MDLQSINWADAALGGTVIISALVGLGRGLIKEILSLVAWLVALWVAYLFAEQIAEQFIRQFIPDTLISYLAAFGLLFIGALFLCGLLNILIVSLFNAAGLSGFDRLLGMLFGLARGAVIGALLVMFAAFIPSITQESFWKQSKLVPSFLNLANWGVAQMPANIQELIKQANGGSTTLALPENNSSDSAQPPQSPADIQLESLQGNLTGERAERPTIAPDQQAQQAAQSDSLSNSNTGIPAIALESMNASEPETPAPANSSAPALQLESIQ